MATSFKSALKSIKKQRQDYVKLPIIDKVVLYSLWIVAFFLVLYVYWVDFDNTKAIKYFDVDYREGFVLPGDTLIIPREMCLEKKKPAMIHRKIVDTIEYKLPSTESITSYGDEFEKGECYTNLIQFRIPKLPVNERYYYAVQRETQINPFKSAVVDLQPIYFTVVDPDNERQMEYRQQYIEYVSAVLDDKEKLSKTDFIISFRRADIENQGEEWERGRAVYTPFSEVLER